MQFGDSNRCRTIGAAVQSSPPDSKLRLQPCSRTSGVKCRPVCELYSRLQRALADRRLRWRGVLACCICSLSILHHIYQCRLLALHFLLTPFAIQVARNIILYISFITLVQSDTAWPSRPLILDHRFHLDLHLFVEGILSFLAGGVYRPFPFLQLIHPPPRLWL